MSISDKILAGDKVYGGISPTMDLSTGGHFGYLPSTGKLAANGRPYEAWIANQAYVQRHIIPIVLRAPKFFNYMPNSAKWLATYKAMFENLPQEINGLQSGLTVETDEHPVGGGGEMQEEITDVKRARSAISINYKEKAGKAILKFYDTMIRYGMMDPDTKTALIGNYLNINQLGGMYTPDFYTGTIMWIEPDITNTNVVDAWLSFNVFPKLNGERTGKRALASAAESPDLTIDFASVTLNNEATMKLAQNILNSLQVIRKVPNTDIILPVDGIDANIKARAGVGFNS